MALRRLSLLIAIVALVAAACGTDTEPTPTDAGDTPPPAAGACLEGSEDCNDTMAPGETPPDLPPSDELPSDDGVTSGAIVDGGLTVSEALVTDATGVLAVQGFIVDDGTTARFCEALAESFPPQCGGATIEVTGYETTIDPDDLTTDQGVTWTDFSVVLFGDLVDGTLIVDPTVTG